MKIFSPSAENPFYTLPCFFKDHFGGKVRKISLDAGFSCPNRTGKERSGGCFWCDPGGSGPGGDVSRWEERLNAETKRFIKNGYLGTIAYFQAFSNTLGEIPFLRSLYIKAMSVEGVLGIAVGTRPDCLSEEVLDLLGELNKEHFLWVEVGMQTALDETLRLCNRGHDHRATVAAVENLKGRDIRVVLHLVAGLPGESEKTMLESFDEAARLKPWGIKLHPLHIVKGSEFEKWFHDGRIKLLTLEDYAGLAASLIERADRKTVIHRITGERPEGVLVAPEWCQHKNRARNAILKALRSRGSFQGASAR
jgi:uncharacterized protein